MATYLDCGCYISDEFKRTWCPTCMSIGSIKRHSEKADKEKCDQCHYKQSHDKLVEALTMLVRYASIRPVTGVVYPEGTHGEWINKARQALELAEGS